MIDMMKIPYDLYQLILNITPALISSNPLHTIHTEDYRKTAKPVYLPLV